MKTFSLSLFVGTLICMSTPYVLLAAPKQPSKMTCQDFVALDEVARPKAFYWADGYSRYGLSDDAIIDFDENDRLVPVILEECTKTPKVALVSKIKEVKTKHKT
jgi:hypothetical protein